MESLQKFSKVRFNTGRGKSFIISAHDVLLVTIYTPNYWVGNGMVLDAFSIRKSPKFENVVSKCTVLIAEEEFDCCGEEVLQNRDVKYLEENNKMFETLPVPLYVTDVMFLQSFRHSRIMEGGNIYFLGQ